jgi:hypothetical protein
LLNLSDFLAANTGTHGIYVLGGLEVMQLHGIHTFQTGGDGLHIQTTAGVNSPIQYLDIDDSNWFIWSQGNNINLNGVMNDITIDGVNLNAPQWLPQKQEHGLAITAYDQIVPSIYMTSSNQATSQIAYNIRVTRCFAEQTQALLQLDGDGTRTHRWQQVRIEKNSMIQQNPAWGVWYLAGSTTVVYDLVTEHNFISQGVRYWFPQSTPNSSDQFIQLRDNWGFGASLVGATNINGKPLGDNQLTPPVKWDTSTGLGDGTASTFTFTLPAVSTPGSGNQLLQLLYLVTTNSQSAQNDGVGGYLVFCTRMPSGNWSGSSLAFSATTGFSAAPTVNAAGTISVPLAADTRARVTRIDNLPLNVAYPLTIN